MVNGISPKVLSGSNAINPMLTPRGSIGLLPPVAPASVCTLLCALSFSQSHYLYIYQQKPKDNKEKHISRAKPGASTKQMKHTDILQGRQKKCPLEQWQRSGRWRRRRGRRGWPWQITNKRMDNTSLARKKPTWKSTVSRTKPRNSI